MSGRNQTNVQSTTTTCESIDKAQFFHREWNNVGTQRTAKGLPGVESHSVLSSGSFLLKKGKSFLACHVATCDEMLRIWTFESHISHLSSQNRRNHISGTTKVMWKNTFLMSCHYQAALLMIILPFVTAVMNFQNWRRKKQQMFAVITWNLCMTCPINSSQRTHLHNGSDLQLNFVRQMLCCPWHAMDMIQDVRLFCN